jgi:hypothetical protein
MIQRAVDVKVMVDALRLTAQMFDSKKGNQNSPA